MLVAGSTAFVGECRRRIAAQGGPIVPVIVRDAARHKAKAVTLASGC